MFVLIKISQTIEFCVENKITTLHRSGIYTGRIKATE